MPKPIVDSVVICNSALLKIGADLIQSLNQTCRAAQVCKALYANRRDQVLDAAAWRFATKRQTITPNSSVPQFDWQYTYDLPNDCIRPLRFDDDSIMWAVEGNQILSDEPSLNLVYIWRCDDENSWDACFGETLAWRLAADLALALTQSQPMFESANKQYESELAQARSRNSLLGTLPPLEADKWSKARKGYRSFNYKTGQSLP